MLLALALGPACTSGGDSTADDGRATAPGDERVHESSEASGERNEEVVVTETDGYTIDPEGQALRRARSEELLTGRTLVARRTDRALFHYVEVSDGDDCVMWRLAFSEGKGHRIAWDRTEGCDPFG